MSRRTVKIRGEFKFDVQTLILLCHKRSRGLTLMALG